MDDRHHHGEESEEGTLGRLCFQRSLQTLLQDRTNHSLLRRANVESPILNRLSFLESQSVPQRLQVQASSSPTSLETRLVGRLILQHRATVITLPYSIPGGSRLVPASSSLERCLRYLASYILIRMRRCLIGLTASPSTRLSLFLW